MLEYSRWFINLLYYTVVERFFLRTKLGTNEFNGQPAWSLLFPLFRERERSALETKHCSIVVEHRYPLQPEQSTTTVKDYGVSIWVSRERQKFLSLRQKRNPLRLGRQGFAVKLPSVSMKPR